MDKRMNLLQGLENFKNRTESETRKSITDNKIEDLMTLYANIQVLMDKANELNMWEEVIYPCQTLQTRIMNVAKRMVLINRTKKY